MDDSGEGYYEAQLRPLLYREFFSSVETTP